MNLVAALLALALACGIQLPPVGVADYQLSGAYTPAADVQVVARDSTAKPAAGLYNIAIAEQCVRFRECAGFAHVYGEHAIDIEYTDDLPTCFAKVCASTARPASAMLRDRNLTPAGKMQHIH